MFILLVVGGKVLAPWIVAAYREPDKKRKQMMQAVIDAVTTGVPTALVEVRRLGRTLKQRAADVLAFFDPTRLG